MTALIKANQPQNNIVPLAGTHDMHEVDLNYWDFFDFDRAMESFNFYINGKSKHTQTAYSRDIKVFIQYLRDEYGEDGFPDRHLLESYVDQLRGDDKSPRTINRYLTPVKLFLRKLASQCPQAPLTISRDPRDLMMMITSVQINQKLATAVTVLTSIAMDFSVEDHTDKGSHGTYLSKEEMQKLLATIQNDFIAEDGSPNLTAYQTYAILKTLVLSGIRIGELRQMNLGKIVKKSSKTYAIMVTGKRNNTKGKQLPIEAFRAIEQYIEAHNAHDPRKITTTSALWRPYNPNGKLPDWEGRFNKDTRSADSIRDLLAKYCDAAAVPKIAPHDCRRFLADQSIENGMPADKAKEALRHKSIGTTIDIYATKQADSAEYWDSINPTTYGVNL